MLQKSERLTAGDVSALAQGKSVFGTLISLRFAPAARLKFAISVSKKAAPRAVDRNRIRRRLYPLLRHARAALSKPWYVMVTAKKECLSAPKEALEKDLASLFNKALK